MCTTVQQEDLGFLTQRIQQDKVPNLLVLILGILYYISYMLRLNIVQVPT